MLPALTVLFPDEGESLASFQKRVLDVKAERVVILSFLEEKFLKDFSLVGPFLKELAAQSAHIRIATRSAKLAQAARIRGFRVFDSARELRKLLEQHPLSEEALRTFSPQAWKQQLRTRLQSVGLLSLPKIRIWSLIIVSALLFIFVFFRLMPSVTVSVWPREDGVSQTLNIFLVQSGALADIPTRVRVMDLVPLVQEIDRTITFDSISKDFVGTNASVVMTFVNNAAESYSFRKGTRLSNQAGMVFRIQDSIIVGAGETETVKAIADDVDLYGEVIGIRGNVPSGLKWDIPGLSEPERRLVYAENRTEATGGITDYRTVLSSDDLDLGKRRLEQELLALAKQLADEEKVLRNSDTTDEKLEILYYDELTKIEFQNFDLPDEFLNQAVTSVPFSGRIRYIAYGYDTKKVLDLLSEELRKHVEIDKRLLEETLTLDRLVTHVIDYSDDLSWIKITVDLSGTEQFILDPLSPTGSKFARKVRENITGISLEDARGIIQNFPEVEKVEFSLWPPWNKTLPLIPSHIYVEPVVKE